MPATTREAALEILRTLVGHPDADFHEGQYEAIETLVDQRRRALVVQRTGWGKSAVYFVATLLLRRQGAGPTILVSPLLALMRDQVAAAARAGVRAVSINSANAHEWAEVLAAARRRRGRRAAGLARTAEQPVRSATSSCRRCSSGPACSWSTRRTASPTGATTSGRTTGGCAT